MIHLPLCHVTLLLYRRISTLSSPPKESTWEVTTYIPLNKYPEIFWNLWPWNLWVISALTSRRGVTPSQILPPGDEDECWTCLEVRQKKTSMEKFINLERTSSFCRCQTEVLNLNCKFSFSKTATFKATLSRFRSTPPRHPSHLTPAWQSHHAVRSPASTGWWGGHWLLKMAVA